MSKIITAAAKATDSVQEGVGLALQCLDRFDGRAVNGYGVYHDPSAHKGVLRDAINRLTEALQLMQATTWPSGQDYDAP